LQQILDSNIGCEQSQIAPDQNARLVAGISLDHRGIHFSVEPANRQPALP